MNEHDKNELSEILLASGDAGYEWDLAVDRITWFGAWDKIFGTNCLPPHDSEKLYNIIFTDDRPLVFGSEELTLDRHYRLLLANGSLVWVHERGTVLRENDQAVIQRGVLRLEDKRPQERIAYAEMQGRDVLTGCYNRAHMLSQIAKATETAKMSCRTASYFVVGVDKMSFVNEAAGMEVGDALLRGVAERLSQIIPGRAMLGRVGGDMFGVLLPEPLGSDMERMAERVLHSFRDQPVVTSQTPLHITVSIGGVRMPMIAKNATETMIFAEQALHDAHQRGRNLFTEYTDSPERANQNRKILELGERIQHAFKHNGFRLAFQPVIETATGQVLFYETLVRMLGSDGVLVAAGQFVPAIEQMGLAFELDRLVLDMSIKELELTQNLYLAVNVSGLTAAQADWPDHVQKVLGGKPDVASRLIIEITETAAIVDVTETRRFVDSLRELGGRVALDDFGAGFTSIRHLRSLSLSIMKIDKDLLHNILTNGEQQHLVRMLIELARGLGLKTVAEGVETEEVADWLRRENVDMMQGYYFGKPSLERPWLELEGAQAPFDKLSKMLSDTKSGMLNAVKAFSPLESLAGSQNPSGH
ncbi:MAG: GGDEF and EAL domain-containing protein [Bdellovibrionales bacterium]